MKILKTRPSSKSILTIILPFFGAFGAWSIVILAFGTNPIDAYASLFMGGFGSKSGLSETLIKSGALLLCASGLLIAFKCGFINLGAEGQFYWGAIVATGIGFGAPLGLFHLPIIFIACFLVGMAWATIPAILKVKLGVSEIISTTMLNFIPVLIAEYLAGSPWRDPNMFEAQTIEVLPSARLFTIVPGTRIHFGLVIAVLAIIFVYVFIWKTHWGYEIRTVGVNVKAAHYGGISELKTILIAAALSGGFAALAGMYEICGVQYRLQRGISGGGFAGAVSGYGAVAVAVVWLARLNPLMTFFSSIFFAGLLTGGRSMQIVAGVPLALVETILATVLLLMLAGEMLGRRRK